MAMRKVVVVALREYNAAVRTKTFLIGLLMMPRMMGGSILAQLLPNKYRDTSEKRFAVVDRTPGAVLLPALEKAVADYNAAPETQKKDRPPFAIEKPKEVPEDPDE